MFLIVSLAGIYYFSKLSKADISIVDDLLYKKEIIKREKIFLDNILLNIKFSMNKSLHTPSQNKIIEALKKEILSENPGLGLIILKPITLYNKSNNKKCKFNIILSSLKTTLKKDICNSIGITNKILSSLIYKQNGLFIKTHFYITNKKNTDYSTGRKIKEIIYLKYYKPLNWILISYSPYNISSTMPGLMKVMNYINEHFVLKFWIVSFAVSLGFLILISLPYFYKNILIPLNNDSGYIKSLFTKDKTIKNYSDDIILIEKEKILIQETRNISEYINKFLIELYNKNRKLKQSFNKLKSIIENMPGCLLIAQKNDRGFIISFANSFMKECLSKHKKELLVSAKYIKDIFGEVKNIQNLAETVLTHNKTIDFITKCPIGKMVKVHMYKIDENEIACSIIDVNDTISQLKRKEKIEKTLELFLNEIKIGIVVINKKVEIKFVNTFAKKLLGFNALDKLDTNKINIPTTLKRKLLKVLKRKETIEEYEIGFTTLDGKKRVFELCASPITIDGDSLVLISFNDITQRYLKDKKLEYLSFHDSLTGLYNRRYFEEELKRLFNKRNYPLTLVLCDLNGLKIINDILGHDIGDKLIIKISEILSTSSRGSDIVARIGGDEFAVLMPNTDENGALNLIKRIKEKVKQNNRENRDIRLSISCGFATQSGELEEPDELFKEADKSMYMNKYSRNRKNELRKIIEWAISRKEERVKRLKNDIEYFLNR